MAVEKRMAVMLAPQTLLFLAGLVWFIVGSSLVIKGGDILTWNPSWLLLALVVGTAKAYFILDKIARRNVQRLQSFAEPLFVGRVYVARTWAIIVVMIILGRVLRMQGIDPQFSGFFSLAVGSGLFAASRLLWQGWLKGRKS